MYTYYTDDGETDQERSGTTLGESATRTDEETSTNATTDGNHVQMSGFQGLVKLVVLVGSRATLERLCGQTKARHERWLLAFDVVAIGVRRGLFQRAVHTLDLGLEGLVDTGFRIHVGAEMRSGIRHSGRSRQMPMKVEGDVDVDCNGDCHHHEATKAL